MSRARSVLSLALAGCLALALASCGSTAMPTPTPTPTVTPSGDGVLRIGTLIPTSGAFAFLGPAQVAGVEVAVREINEAGGVGGVPVEVFHRDSGEAGNQIAEASFADLVAKGVDVVIGPTSSAIAQRLLPAREQGLRNAPWGLDPDAPFEEGVLIWDLALVRLLGQARWRSWLQRRVVWLVRLCGGLLLVLGLWLVCA